MALNHHKNFYLNYLTNGEVFDNYIKLSFAIYCQIVDKNMDIIQFEIFIDDLHHYISYSMEHLHLPL